MKRKSFWFKTDLEKKYWIRALTTQLAIYASLPYVDKIQGLLPRELIDLSFLICMILIVIFGIIIGIKKSKNPTTLGIGIGIVAVYLLIFIRMNIPQERTHLIEYGVVAIFIFEALNERFKKIKNLYQIAVLAILITSIAGLIDECIQYFLPKRIFDTRDILFNFLAGVLAITSLLLLKKSIPHKE